MDPFLLEAIVNGILLGGVFALPVLGLNLVFGVVDVVWLCSSHHKQTHALFNKIA